MAGKSSSSGGFGKFLFGILFGIVLLVAGAWAYLRFGNVPVAVADTAWTWERQITHTALDARIARETKPAPFGTSEDVYEAGAHTYMQHCAVCHGTPGHTVSFANDMYPAAPPLWATHQHAGGASHVGVSDDDPGETYWKVANGIRLTGMPAFKNTLTDIQMWQVSLLLKNADQSLPDPVKEILAKP